MIGLLRRLISERIDARLAQPTSQWPNDLLSRLLSLHHEAPATWSLDDVRDECMTTFLAGHETGAASLTWWAWLMATHPEDQRKVREELNTTLGTRALEANDLPSLVHLSQTLHEALRLYPPTPLLFSRRTIAPISMGGYTFPKGTMFTIPVHLLHHDARSYQNPEEFRPERFAKGAPTIPRGAYLPFGAGPRVCLGQHLAMTEMMYIAATLLQRFELQSASGVPAPIPHCRVTLRPKTPLVLSIRRIDA